MSKITISTSDKLGFISNLSTMMNAGIPILEVIDSLLDESKGNMRKVLKTIREDLMEGKHLYVSLSKFPENFDRVTVNILKASEESGTLDITLKDLKEQIKKEIEFSDKIKSALIYPFLILIVFSGVLILILTVVMPKIASVFLRLKIVLPLPTKILIFLSQLLLSQTIPVVIVLTAIILLFVYLYKTKKSTVESFIFSLPLIRKLVKEIDLTRFSRSMYLLLSSGITITSALDLTQDVVLRKDIASAIGFAKETVLSGKDISEAFKMKKNIFSSIMIKILQAGEKSGTLDKSMQDISEYLDYEVSNTLKTIIALLEPILLVVIGILVGGMMLSILVPIYSIVGQIGGGR